MIDLTGVALVVAALAYALLERWRRVAAEGDVARARRLLRRLSGREWQRSGEEAA